MTTTNRTMDVSYKAEEAPLGVLLWPVRAAEYEPNFTLRSVAVVRGDYGTRVEWTYESGTTRTFDFGEEVACRIPFEETCGEGPHGEPCGRRMDFGECPVHGEVGP